MALLTHAHAICSRVVSRVRLRSADCADRHADAASCRVQVALFFFMSFVNTVIDSMKDSLVITAVGGGTEVIPFLTGAQPRQHCCICTS